MSAQSQAAEAARTRPATPGHIARRFVDHCGEDILYARVEEGGQWYRWQGQHWVRCSADEIQTQVASPYVSSLIEEPEFAVHSRSIDTITTHRACVAHARGHENVSVPASELDANPEHLGTPAGVVDLRTGCLLSPDERHRVTKSTPLEAADGRPEQWLDFLAWAMSDEPERVDWLQEALGMSLIGKVMDEVFFICTGEGANGKTVLLEVVRGVIGSTGADGYAQNAPRGFLTSGLDRHQTEIARLNGARFVTISETGKSDSFDEDKVKALASTNALSGNFMRENIRDFLPTHHLWLATNYLPSVRDGGLSFYRRAKIVEFGNTIEERDQNKTLARDLVAEEGGKILAWLIEGARRYLERGRLPECEAIEEAGKRFRHSQEGFAVEKFVDEYCTLGRNEYDALEDLHKAYEAACRNAGAEPLGRNKFSAALSSHPLAKEEPPRIRKKKMSFGMAFQGLTMDPDACANLGLHLNG